MLQNALWCQITWSKCMLCNILEYCTQTLDIHGQRVLQLILFLFMTFNYWEYVIECVFAVEGHMILKIWLILRILKISSCTSLLTPNIEYGDIMIGVNKLVHDEIFKILNINHIFNIICPQTQSYLNSSLGTLEYPSLVHLNTLH